MSSIENKLKKVHDPRQISAMLLSAKEKCYQAFVWRIIGDKKIMAEVQIDLVLSARQELRISPKPQSIEAFNHVIGGCESVNLFFAHSAILFQSSVKGPHGQHGVILTLPSFIAYMERRNWLRMSGEHQARLRLQFTKKSSLPRSMNQFFSKALFDLGAGGLSFLATRVELRFLTEGEGLKGLELLVDGEKLKLDAQVIRIQEMASSFYGKSYKVSLRFERIEKKDQEKLIKFVFQNLPPSHQAV